MGDKNNIQEVEGVDKTVKIGHGIIKAIYVSRPGDRVWVIRDGTSSNQATGTVTVCCPVANVFACGQITVAFCCIAACDTVTINGLVFTGVCGAKDCTDTQFSICTNANTVAADLADSIDDDVRAGTIGDVTSTATCAVITTVSDTCGTLGNNISQGVSNSTAFVCVDAVFSGGVDADTVTINGLLYTGVDCAKCGNTEFSVCCTNCVIATDLALSITCDTRTGLTVPLLDQVGAAVCAVVTVTADAGQDGNLIGLVSNDAATLAVSGAFLTGGTGQKVITVEAEADGGYFLAPYINHPVALGIQVDAVSGNTGAITIVYE